MNARPPEMPNESRLIPLLAGIGYGFAIGVGLGYMLFG